MGPSFSAASATTWLFVMKCPWVSSTKPEPVAPASCPWYCATICTVLGSTRCATAATDPFAAGSGDVEVAPVSCRPPATRPSRPGSEAQRSYAAPPSAPAVPPTIRASAQTTGQTHRETRLRSCRCRCGAARYAGMGWVPGGGYFGPGSRCGGARDVSGGAPNGEPSRLCHGGGGCVVGGTQEASTGPGSGGSKGDRERGRPGSGAVSSWSEGCSGRSLTVLSSQRQASAASAGAAGGRRDDARERRGRDRAGLRDVGRGDPAVDRRSVRGRRTESQHAEHGDAGRAAADGDEAAAAGLGAQRQQRVARRQSGLGAHQRVLEPVGGGGAAERQPGEAGLDPALALDEVAAVVAGVHVLPGAVLLVALQLTVEEVADAVAEVSADHAGPAARPPVGTGPGCAGPAYR